MKNEIGCIRKSNCPSSSDSGTAHRIYDAADRIIASTDTSANHATYLYDVTGCIRQQTIWDTVAQFGANGAANGDWQLDIPTEAKNVFHAVALNEYRYAFPGESIRTGTQRGFIGSHADIGGSYGKGDLSDVALNWIVEQAKTSGVKMFDWGENKTNKEWGIVSTPVLHDKSGTVGLDGEFCLRVNNEKWTTGCQSRRNLTGIGMTSAESRSDSFMSLYEKSEMDKDGSSKIVGEINMKEYAKWLKTNYGITIAFTDW